MDIFDGLMHGFEVAITPMNLLFVFIGVLMGMVIGVLPGLGPTTTIAILLPVTFGLDAATAIIMLAGIYYGAMYGGTIASVLVKVPGEVASVVTTFDGYQMARQGRAGPALGIAAIGSFIGGTVSVFFLVLLAAPLAKVVEKFGAPELFLVALAGLVLILAMGGQSLVKATAMVALGLIIAAVGQDQVTGTGRLDFGLVELLGGIEIVAVAMGMFGIGEILTNLDGAGATSKPLATKITGVFPGRKDLKRSAMPIVRGTAIGSVLGLLPGGGSVLASMASYATEKRASKHPEEFGKGAIEGVAGPETANNAGSTMSFLPLLTLGLPTGTVMALIFGALLLQGVTPGPTLVTNHPEIFWGVIASMFIGNIVLLLMNLPLVGVFIQLLRVRMGIIGAVTMIITLVGVYALNNSHVDVITCLVAGVAGYLLRKAGMQPGPLVLAAVLGALLELNLRNALAMSGGTAAIFVQRPVSLALLITVILIIAYLAFRTFRSRKSNGEDLFSKVRELQKQDAD